MPNPVAAITIAHLNDLLDTEIEGIKRMDTKAEKKLIIIMYIESLQRRINRSAFDQMAKGREGNNE